LRKAYRSADAVERARIVKAGKAIRAAQSTWPIDAVEHMRRVLAAVGVLVVEHGSDCSAPGVGQQRMDKPPTKTKPSVEASNAPEPRQRGTAPIVAVAGVYTRRPVWKKDGTISWQKFSGHPS